MNLINNVEIISFLNFNINKLEQQQTKIIIFNSSLKYEQIYLESLGNSKFEIGIENHFFFRVLKFIDYYVIYQYKDFANDFNIEFNNNLTFIKISEFAKHSIINTFFNTMIKTIVQENQSNTIEILEFDSFATIRTLFLVCLLNSSVFGSWGFSELLFDKDSISFKVDAHHLKGKVQILYCFGSDLFKVNFFDNQNLLIGGKTNIYIDQLIDFIDQKIEYTETYK